MRYGKPATSITKLLARARHALSQPPHASSSAPRIRRRSHAGEVPLYRPQNSAAWSRVLECKTSVRNERAKLAEKLDKRRSCIA